MVLGNFFNKWYSVKLVNVASTRVSKLVKQTGRENFDSRPKHLRVIEYLANSICFRNMSPTPLLPIWLNFFPKRTNAEAKIVLKSTITNICSPRRQNLLPQQTLRENAKVQQLCFQVTRTSCLWVCKVIIGPVSLHVTPLQNKSFTAYF